MKNTTKAPFPHLEHQRGLATTAQLRAAGWTKASLAWLAESRGRQLARTVYIDHRGEPDAATLLVGDWLFAGADSVLTGVHALLQHGLTGQLPTAAPVFLVDRGHRDRRTPTCHVARTSRPPRRRTLGGIPTAAPERALADVGRFRQASGEAAAALAIAVLQQRLTTPARVLAELAAGNTNGTAGVRRGVRDYLMGAWSLPEAHLLRLLARRLPSLDVLPNPRLLTLDDVLIGVPDGYLRDYGVVLQVHSKQYHDGVGDDGRDLWASTVEADSDYCRFGMVVVGVVPTTLRDTPERFVELVRATTRARAGVPLPRIKIEPRSTVSRPTADPPQGPKAPSW